MGGGHGHGGTTYKGVTIHQPKRWHTVTGKGLCAVMWYVPLSLSLFISYPNFFNFRYLASDFKLIVFVRFWVMYRAKQDAPVVLVTTLSAI